MNSYRVVVKSQAGSETGYIIDRFEKLEYVLNEYEPGAMTLMYSATDPALPPLEFWRDGMQLEIYRTTELGREYIEGSASDGAVWLVNNFRRYVDSGGIDRILISGNDAKELLKRRIINYRQGTYGATQEDLIDELMRLNVYINLGGGAGFTEGDVTLRATNVAIALQSPLLWSVKKEIAWENLFDVLKEMAISTQQAQGNYAYTTFDVIRDPASPTGLAFYVYVDIRGVNRGGGTYSGIYNPIALQFSTEEGTLKQPSLTLDYSESYNYIRVGGEGTGAGQTIANVVDQALMKNGGQYGRREAFVAGQGVDVNALIDTGYEYMLAHRPTLQMSAKLVDTPNTRYGVHWNHGDIVAVHVFGRPFDGRVIQVHVTVQQGTEDIDATVSSTQPNWP